MLEESLNVNSNQNLRLSLANLSECQIESAPLEYRNIIRLLSAEDICLHDVIRMRKEDFDGSFFFIRSKQISVQMLSKEDLDAFRLIWMDLQPREYFFDSSISRWGFTSSFHSFLRQQLENAEAQSPRIVGKPPDALLIGFPKCGTTWFYEMCREFPIIDAPRKEICFFSTSDFCKGYSWYLNFFRGEERLHVDISSDYILNDLAIQRIKQFREDVKQNLKFIVFVRKPSRQILSAINHRKKGGRGWIDFEKYILSGNAKKIVRKANYFERLRAFKKIAGPSQMKIVFQEDIAKDSKKEFINIVQFIRPELDLSAIRDKPEIFFERTVNKGVRVVNFTLLKFLVDLDLFNRRVFGRSSLRKANTLAIRTLQRLLCHRSLNESTSNEYRNLLQGEEIFALDVRYEEFRQNTVT